MMQFLLWEMRNIGYENATTMVDLGNFRAQLFYTNMDYTMVDTNYQFFKDLQNSIPLSVYAQVGCF